jgi:hypothetical protein
MALPSPKPWGVDPGPLAGQIETGRCGHWAQTALLSRPRQVILKILSSFPQQMTAEYLLFAPAKHLRNKNIETLSFPPESP